MSKDFPEGLKYAIRYDTTKFVRGAVSKVYETLFVAGILVLIVIMVFLQSFRALLVPATTVPVTIIGAFIAMIALGFTINLMTLFALVLAIGIVVDDAIVIVENSAYYIERGLSPKEAAIKAMGELTGPIMGITMALDRGLPAGSLFARHYRTDLPSICSGHCRNSRDQRHQCHDPETGPVRPLAAARQEKPLNWFYRGFNKAYEAVKRPLHGARALDGEAAGAHGRRLLRHHHPGGLAVCAAGLPASFPPRTRVLPSYSLAFRTARPSRGHGKCRRRSALFSRRPPASPAG